MWKKCIVGTSVAESCSPHTLHSEETCKHIFLGNKCSFMYKRHLQENETFSFRSPRDSQTNESSKMFCESSRTSFLQVRDRQKGHSIHHLLLGVEKSETPSSTSKAQHLPVQRNSNNIQYHLAAGKISFVTIKPCLQLQLNGKLTVTREVTIVPQKKKQSLSNNKLASTT